MAVVIASDLAKDMAGEPLLRGVSFKLERRDRLTIAGRNGAGKTTLLRMLAGETSVDGGDLSFAKGVRVALHDQRPPRERALSLRDYVLGGCGDLVDLEEELAALAQRMAEGDERAYDAYSRAEARLEHAGGWNWRDRALDFVRGLGFAEADLDRELSTFSGGELTRCSLARALAAQPDLLLLDEPTNHLDITALEWLEKTLTALDTAVVLVAHDRWFIEAVGTAVLELEAGRSRFFSGTWTAWRKEVAARELALGRAIDKQRAEIARLERFVERFRAKATKARQAQSRVKRLDKMERIEGDPRDTRALGFSFKPPERSGRVVLELEGGRVEVGADPPRTLLEDAELWVERGEHVTLVGPNGAGKTTLIATLAGQRELAAGKLRRGHNVKLGYLSQHADEFDPKSDPTHPDARTVLEACQRATTLKPNQARALLGRFMFSGAEAQKPIEGLSGGERRRLSLAILVASGANLLIIDEPTNHLDLESREALEDALLSYDGTLILISHDRALLSAVGSRTVAVEDGTLRSYLGGWEDYVREREERRAVEVAASRGEGAGNGKPASGKGEGAKRTAAVKGRGAANGVANLETAGAGAGGGGGAAGAKPSKNRQREAAKLERRIEEAEASLARVEDGIAGPEAWSSPRRSAESSARHDDAKRLVAELYARYEALAG
ncbi:MAG: ABC-F family ATP-binding cassette domain-containing protein [Solirubrobacteraceae bacterium MAG38_C4-C5]|nr:ABC-F family ATP-binding cassette domain-containing protein [Candidatus Siliceabacter maunaloa]